MLACYRLGVFMPDTPYRQFLDRVPDGFLLFDEQGGLLDANAQACASLGHHKAAMLGLGIMLSLIHI